MNTGVVRDYVAQSNSVLDSSPQMDEANTKAAILRDFLDLLNWEIPTNTQLEYSVEAFGQTYKVDYALVLDGTPVAFLEAKGADTTLSSGHNEQLSSYMMNKNVNYGILTNGKDYRFFQRQVDASNVTVQKVGDMALDDLPDRISVLKAYKKDAIESGESEKVLDRINELRDARQTLETEKDDLAVELSNVLAEHVSETISTIAKTQAKEMVDRVIQDIEGEINPSQSDSLDRYRETHSQSIADPSSAPPQEQGKTEQNDGPASARIESRPREESPFDKSEPWVITFLDGETEIAAVSGHDQSEAMVEATNYLINQHDLISEIEPLPWVPSRTKAIINDTQEWDQADAVYKQLVDGNYLDIKLSKDAKKRELDRMAEKCGIRVEFDGDW